MKTIATTIALALIGTAAVADDLTSEQQYKIDVWNGKLEEAQRICDGFEGPKTLKAAHLIWPVVQNSKKEELVPYMADKLEALTDCLNTTHEGEPYTYYPERGEFLREATLEKERLAEEAERLETIRLEKKRQFELEVARRIKDACYDVAKSDPLRAYRDQTCLIVFEIHGLP